MKHINILLLGGSKKNSLVDCFLQEGKKRNIVIKFYSYELNDIEPIRDVACIIKGKRWTDPEIESDLIKKIKEFDINVVIPFVDIATIICSKLSSKIENVFFVVSPHQTNIITYNKDMMHEWFVSNNFKTPSTDHKLPLVAKPKTGSGAKGLLYLATDEDYKHFAATKKTTDYFIQEAVTGTEYSIDCYVDFISGGIVSIVPRKRLEVINGEAVRTITDKNAYVINIATDILKTNIFRGPVTIQLFTLNDLSQYAMIEINPRMGSGAYASIYAGANTCCYILNNYTNIENKPETSWQDGLTMVRAYKEYYYADNC